MEHPEYLPEDELNADAFAQHVAQDPTAAFRQWRELQNQARFAQSSTPVSSTHAAPSPPVYTTLDPATLSMIAQIVAQTIQNQPSPSIPAPIVHLPATPITATTTPARLSEKLPDIEQYDGDRDKLDAWEQSLIQRMNINHDRYPTDSAKIAYAESRLIIGKKASNLMMLYRQDGICTITTFVAYRAALRRCCGNPFEAEDARTYLRDTLKQGSNTFAEYYQSFCQKKDRSGMEDASLIDCFKRNVTYSTQLAALNWRNSEGKKPSTFQEYVDAFTEIDEELQQLKHRQPRAAISPAAHIKPKPSSFSTAVTPRPLMATPVATTTPVAIGDPMDLSAAMAVTQGKSLKIPGIKEICNKFNLCYYCKKQHSGKTAKDCPNKTLAQLRLADLDDTLSNDGGVSIMGKA